MKVLVVLTLELEKPEDLPASLEKIDPPNVPGFKGKIRIAIDPIATQVEEWLDT